MKNLKIVRQSYRSRKKGFVVYGTVANDILLSFPDRRQKKTKPWPDSKDLKYSMELVLPGGSFSSLAQQFPTKNNTSANQAFISV